MIPPIIVNKYRDEEDVVITFDMRMPDLSRGKGLEFLHCQHWIIHPVFTDILGNHPIVSDRRWIVAAQPYPGTPGLSS